MKHQVSKGRSLKIPLRVRCIARREGDQWTACTLEFGLAVQADSFSEAKRKLEVQIKDFVREALAQDVEFADQLLRRRAPMWAYAIWHTLKIVGRSGKPVAKVAQRSSRAFFEPTPRLAVAA